MRLRIRLFTGGLLAVLLIATSALAAPSAHAGGPTSVLLSAPEQEKVTALHHSDPRYLRLADQVGGFGASPASGNEVSPVSGAFNRQIRLTWLIHDMTVWRIDIIHPFDGWVIETRAIDSDGNWTESRYHRPGDPEQLQKLVHSLGLSTGDEPAADPTPAEPTGGSTPPDTEPSGTASSGTASSGTESSGTESGVDRSASSAALGPASIGAGIAGLIIGVGGYHLIVRRRASARPPDRIDLIG